MKHFALAALTFLSLAVQAQTLYLKSGAFTPTENVKTLSDFPNWNQARFGDKTYCLVQFQTSTAADQLKQISAETGIQFYEYFPKWAFFASIPNNYPVYNLDQYGVRSVLPYQPTYKIEPGLLQRPFPSWMSQGTSVNLLVQTLPDLSQTQASLLFQQEQIKPNWQNEHLALIQVDESRLTFLSELPWIHYIQMPSAPAQKENLTERTDHRVNWIDAAYVTGLHFDGTGIGLGIGDDGAIGPHIDFAGRVVDHTSVNGGSHGDHVCGIAAGGGNFDPQTTGTAKGAKLHIYQDYDNITNIATDYAAYGIRITSNSLGQTCNAGYDLDAKTSDFLIRAQPSLMSVHSAGNSGNGTCGGVPQGYFTITGGYKSAKNVLTVGNVDAADLIDPSSSKGPAKDGRIKPELVAVGSNVYSTQPDNTYANLSGTSMAAPAVAGSLADLYQAYRSTHGGNDPGSDLMKCVLMNTADDLGNPGPDYTYGYGRINLRKAYQALSNNQYFVDSITNGNSKDFFVNVPANTRQMKIMLYWNDFEGNPASSISLVNDLNLSVQEPSGNVLDPWVLSTTPTAVALGANATQGPDNLNNVEQVTMDSVFPGPCIITVSGNDVPVGPQKFVLVYYFINNQATLTYPNGGESFVVGQKERVRWDAYGNTGFFKLEYSANAGTTWNTISNSIPGNLRYYDWTPPGFLNTGKMTMRISRGPANDQSDSLFTVMDVPKNLTVDTACGTTFHLKWDPVSNVTGYRIWSMGPQYMTEIGTSTTNSFVITSGVNTTDTFYFAVSAINATNGGNGQRTVAYIKLPGSVNCVDDADNVATLMPFTDGYTCATASPIAVKVKIKNLGLRPIVNLPIFYQINATPVVAEVLAGPVAVGDSTIYTFTTLANLSLPGTYTITTWTSVYTDIVTSNDTSMITMNVNIPTVLTAPTVEDFEGPLFPPTGWRVIDADTSVKWQKTLVLADPTGFNTHTAYMDFFNYTHLDQIDDLETAEYDLTGVTADTVLLTFDISHALGNLGGVDSLQILVSEDCAVNFTPTTYFKGGVPLATTGMMNAIFSPTLTSQWRNDRLNLTSYIGKKIFIRFRAKNEQGNSLFIDNINIMLKNAWPLGVPSFNEDGLTVYPNPSDGNYTLEFSSTESKEIRYAILNLAGQTLRETRLPVSNGKTKTALNLSSFASGVYMLELKDGDQRKKIKLIKY